MLFLSPIFSVKNSILSFFLKSLIDIILPCALFLYLFLPQIWLIIIQYTFSYFKTPIQTPKIIIIFSSLNNFILLYLCNFSLTSNLIHCAFLLQIQVTYIMNFGQDGNLRLLQRIVKWLNKTEGRDKLCKLFQYVCLLLSSIYKSHDYYSLQFQTLYQSVKDARKLFRLFKSLMQYQKLVAILLDDDDNMFKIFRVLSQIFFFLFWLFDNISVLCKIKLLKWNVIEYNKLTSYFWTISLLSSIPILAIQSRNKRIEPKKATQMKIDCMRFTLDLLPATYESKIFERIFKIPLQAETVAIGGIISSLLSTYGVLIDC